jgi:ACS family pantothenate transporter-like MFS transporter
MNEFAYVLQAWLPLIVWQQVEAPEYRKGYITMVFLSATMIATALVVRTLHARELGKKSREGIEGQDEASNSGNSAITKNISELR